MRYKIALLLSVIWIFGACKTGHRAAETNTKHHKTKVYQNNATACYYHDQYNGKKTASGALFSNKKLTAAHKTLPFGTRLLITNPTNNQSVEVEVNDRGPFTKGFDIDLSKKAFMQITDQPGAGTLNVRIELIP